jgi:hypothetical protein
LPIATSIATPMPCRCRATGRHHPLAAHHIPTPVHNPGIPSITTRFSLDQKFSGLLPSESGR